MDTVRGKQTEVKKIGKVKAKVSVQVSLDQLLSVELHKPFTGIGNLAIPNIA